MLILLLETRAAILVIRVKFMLRDSDFMTQIHKGA